MSLRKYPRTQHLEGSRLQPGDEDLEAVPLRTLAGRHLVVEEKVDGANAGISFDDSGSLRLQSRGHFLRGGGREKHFALFKTWATRHRDALFAALGSRYVLYGEWLYAKHTIFYDQLPHYFLEFDLLDRETGDFLSTPARREALQDAPVVSVPVLATGQFRHIRDLETHVGVSVFKSERWKENLKDQAQSLGQDPALISRQTDLSDESEGLYVKWEADGVVRGRYKYVRASFLTSVVDSGGHWLDRPILPNLLGPGVDIFGGT